MRKPFNVQTIGKVYAHFNGKCSKCQGEENLHIHHLDLNHNNSNIDNLILLCKFCHRLVHSKEGKKTYYDEKQIRDYIDYEIKHYFKHELGWKVNSDCTDHFSFSCPICKSPAIVEEVKIWNDGKVGKEICPCFYFELKCNKCKIQGQRKCYLNPDLLEKTNKRWEAKWKRNGKKEEKR